MPMKCPSVRLWPHVTLTRWRWYHTGTIPSILHCHGTTHDIMAISEDCLSSYFQSVVFLTVIV